MKDLTKLPNIGATLAEKLQSIGINTEKEFNSFTTEQIILRLSAIENHGLCSNMTYALEGAKQGIRWHGLDKERKEELLQFLRSLNI